MTSLSLQLKRLALPQTDPNLFTRKEVASLLFEPKDAATMDNSTFYALGCTGLEELLGIEPSLSEFQQSLFSSSSLTLERSVQTKDINRKLDQSVGLFLSRVCPYFLLRPTHKCLEWLIHRFHIHLYNVDSLVACALPYHDTKIFVRVVQLLKIDEATNKWNWLHCLQKPGVPLSRLTLVTHCYKDLGFMDFICNMVLNSIQAFSECPGGSQLRIIFSFFASTMVSALDSAPTITDAIITKLLPYIHKGLRSPLVDFRAGSLMLLCQLSVKVVMEKVLVQSLSSALCKSLKEPQPEPALLRESLGALIVLFQNQEQATPTNKALTRLTSVPGLVSSLESMAQTQDVSPLLCHLLPHLLRCTFHSSESSEASSAAADLLRNLLRSVPLTSDLHVTLAHLLLDLYLSQSGLSQEDLQEMNQRLRPVIRVFEAKYNGSLDRALSSRVSELSEEQKPLFHQLLSLSATSGKFQILGDLDSSLLLSLIHPQASVRVLALNKLRDIVSSGEGASVDQDFLKTSVFERLKDDEPSVVSAALTLLQLLLDSVDTEETVSALLSLLLRAQDSYSLNWSQVVSEAVRSLSLLAAAHSDADSERLLFRLLPFVVPSGTSDSVRFKLSLSLSKSAILLQHPLTAGWRTALESPLPSEPDQRPVQSPDQVLVLIQTLVSTLSSNLENMETFSRRHTMESLCRCVERLSEPDYSLSLGPDRTPLLVLLQTLVLGLKTLTDTHHLLTARRVYSVIQRHLLESPGETQEPGGPPDLGPAPSFCDWLGLYLRRCDGQVFSLVLVSVLSHFIQELQSPDEAFKGEVWWNPERLDTNTCCYLQLLAQVFSLLMGGASDGPMAVQYRQLVRLFIKVHLGEPLFLFRFLSLLWSHSGHHGDQVEGREKMRLGAVLQSQALLMGEAMIENYRQEQVHEIVLKSPVLVSLLVVLSSPWREVRRAGLDVLRSLSPAGASVFKPIVERLLHTAEEVAADCSYLSCALGALHSESSPRKQEVGRAFVKLFESVQAPCCPTDTATVLLGALCHVNGEDVLSSLLPAVERLLAQINLDAPLLPDEARLLALHLGKFCPTAAPLLVTDRHCRELFIRAMKTNHRATEGPNIQITALEQISRPFFSALNEEVQQSVLSAMFDLLVQSPSPQVAQSISSVFKQISLDAQLVASELCPPEKPTVAVSVQQKRRSKILQRTAGSGDAQPTEGAVSWHRVTLILELLQHKKKLKRPQALIPPLFTLLQRRVESRGEEQASVEYTKQLLLSCLLSMCTKLSPDGTPIPEDVLDPERLSVELVVQCIRSSEMSQTHHQALLLLSALAPLYPEKVLLNIMPIFTFMGANILRLDDVYSFSVIDKTVQMVIPSIIKTEDWTGPDSSYIHTVVTRVVHVFVDALPHVPEHRRVPILTRLLSTIGVERVLWVLLALLFKQESTATTTADKEPAMDLWASVCHEFSVTVQIQSVIQVLVFLQLLPHDTDQASEKRTVGRRNVKKPQQETMEELIFNTEVHSSKELRHFKYLSVSFCAHLLGSHSFIQQVLELEQGGGDQSLQQLQQKVLEEILQFIHSVAQCVEQNSDKPTAKYWRVLLNKSYELLDKVNALLPSDSFISVTRGLMGNEVSNVRRKALELLNNKLQQTTNWEPPQVSSLLSLLPDLEVVVTSSAEPSVNRQTALFSLKLLCRLFGASEPRSFIAVMQVAVGIVTATEEDRNVTATALQCVTENITALKALTVPHLPSLVPAVLDALTHRKDCVSSEIYLQSAVTALHRLTETLPNFISPYLLDITAQVCRLTRLAEVSSLSPALVTRLDSLRSTLALKIPPRVLLPTVCKCYSRLVTDQKNQLVALMALLQEHIGNMDRDQLTLHQSELTSFFLTALDFRAAHCQDDLEKAEKIEGSVIHCLLSMVLKLSEVTFRPLFFQLLEWSKGSKLRLLTFCRVADAVALRLKGLFVLFAGNLVKPFSDLLQQSQDPDALFACEQKLSMLLRYVLDCLQKIFLFDTQRFLSHERAETLMDPLVNQLENLQGSEGQYCSRVSQSLVPCLGQFAVALGDDTQWKNLNYKILMKTRHVEQKVRVSALAALLELCSKLRENYLVLLPETIPFLAELMEDESEEVEKEVQRVVQEMENILGEPLQSYF